MQLQVFFKAEELFKTEINNQKEGQLTDLSKYRIILQKCSLSHYCFRCNHYLPK